MARNYVDTLVVRLVADATKLKSTLDKTEGDAKRAGISIGRAFASGVANVAVFQAGINAATGALVTAANAAAKYADEIDKTGIRTRLARGTLQELRFVADQTGVAFTGIEANIRAFTGRLSEAERGSAIVGETFQRLGVNLRDTNGSLRDTESLFLETLSALSGLENETERAALAVQAFGEQGSALLPILSAGAGGVDELRQKARELGLVLDDQSIDTLVAYKDQMSAVQQQFGALSREVAIQFLPLLTDGLLPALQKAIDAFRAMPEPMQKGITALTGFGAAATAVATALRVLGVSLSMFGPAGIAFAAVGVIASLAFAFSGKNDSLDAAAKSARAALAGGDKNSMTGALTDLIGKVEGPLQRALVDAQNELRNTGQIGVESARAIELAFAAILAKSALTRRLLDQRVGDALDLAGNDRLIADQNLLVPNAFERVSARVGAGDVAGAAGIVADALLALETSRFRGGERAIDERLITALTDLHRILQNGLAAADAATTIVPGAGGPNLPPPAGSKDRTVKDVFDDLARGGSGSARYAFALNTDAALKQSFTERLGAIDSALRELLTDFPTQVTAAQIGFLTARRREVERILASWQDPTDVANRASQQRQIDAWTPEVRAFQAAEAAQRINESVAAFFNATVDAQLDAWAQEAAAAREQTDLSRVYRIRIAHARALLQQGIVDDAVAQVEQQIGKWDGDAPWRMTRLPITPPTTPDFVQGILDDAALYGNDVLRGLTRGAVDTVDNAVEDIANAMTTGAADLLRHIGAFTGDRRAASLERFSWLPSWDEGMNLGDGARQPDPRYSWQQGSQYFMMPRAPEEARTELERRAAARLEEANTRVALAPGFIGGRNGSDLGRLPFDFQVSDKARELFDARVTMNENRVTVELDFGDKTARDAERQRQEQQQAADTFANTVVQSAFSFGNTLVQSIQSGDIGQAFKGLFDAAGGIAGAANFGSLNLFGGMVPIASLVSGGLGLLGGIFGSLFGNRQDGRREASRAAGANVSGAPSIELRFEMNNSVAVNGMADLSNQLNKTFDNAVRTLEQNVLPRLARLEARA